ncbi:MAG: tyrosine-type recombinase/integrase, partial [Ruminococcus sp.]
QLKNEQLDQSIKCGDLWHDTDRLFITWCGEPMHPNTPYTWLERFCDENKLPFKGLHSFRHTFATQAITSGTDVATVSSILGHSQTSTTLNLYTHAVQAANVKAINVMADLISEKTV